MSPSASNRDFNEAAADCEPESTPVLPTAVTTGSRGNCPGRAFKARVVKRAGHGAKRRGRALEGRRQWLVQRSRKALVGGLGGGAPQRCGSSAAALAWGSGGAEPPGINPQVQVNTRHPGAVYVTGRLPSAAPPLRAILLAR